MIDGTSNLANDAWDCANDVIGCASDTATNIGNTVADGASNILESASDAFNFWLGQSVRTGPCFFNKDAKKLN